VTATYAMTAVSSTLVKATDAEDMEEAVALIVFRTTNAAVVVLKIYIHFAPSANQRNAANRANTTSATIGMTC